MKFRSVRIWTVKFFFGENDKPFLETFFLFRRRAEAFANERRACWTEFEEGKQIKVQVKMKRLWI